MDTLTHCAIGAAIGEVALGRKLGNRAMLWGALLGNLPDIDVVLSPFTDSVHLLTYHRGLTHSLLVTLAAAPLLGWLLARRYRKEGVGWQRSTLLCLLALLSHLLLDACTTYGTPLLLPFSPHRFAFNNIFILDPFYTTPLLVCTLAALGIRRASPWRRQLAWLGLTLSTLYLAASFGGKYEAQRVFTRALAEQQIAAERFVTAPTPLNTVLWYCVAENRDGCYLGYYSLLDRDPRIVFSFVPRRDELLGEAVSDETFQRLVRFSDGYYSVRRRSEERRVGKSVYTCV